MGAAWRQRAASVVAFIHAAGIYWFEIFPWVRRDLGHWIKQAQCIPAPALRELACTTQIEEAGNLEGAAAFAVLAPPSSRREVVRAAVAFQAIYDYVDSLVEVAPRRTELEARDLHLALDAALSPYSCAYSVGDDDGGYLVEMVEACRTAVTQLPSYALVEAPARRAVRRMIDYQAFIHGDGALSHTPFASWAASETPPGCDLRWWETAAGAASSLGVFALVAAAARPSLNEADVAALELAYFPWVGALHVLLDSLIDAPADERTGHLSLVHQYASPEEAAERMGLIARAAMEATWALPNGTTHSLIVTAMAGFYLAAPEAWHPERAPAARAVAAALGELAPAALLILRARRLLRR
jgi:tetraprenyl-beta-curcumene synthase